MRILDTHKDEAVTQAQLYLTESEAEEFIRLLSSLLEDPERNDHEHLFSDNGGCEISFSILTSSKLANDSGYTERERRLFRRGK